MAFVASSPALLRAARAPATSTRRPVAAARVVMAADPQKAPSSEGPVTSGVPPARKYPVRWVERGTTAIAVAVVDACVHGRGRGAGGSGAARMWPVGLAAL